MATLVLVGVVVLAIVVKLLIGVAEVYIIISFHTNLLLEEDNYIISLYERTKNNVFL